MENTVTNYQFYMNVCRNPFGYWPDEVRTARLYICDHAEAMDKLVDKSTREIESLRQQLAAALAACESKDAAILGMFGPTCTLHEDRWDKLSAATAIQPDASALKQHDAELIERCAERAEVSGWMVHPKHIGDSVRGLKAEP